MNVLGGGCGKQSEEGSVIHGMSSVSLPVASGNGALGIKWE